MPEVN